MDSPDFEEDGRIKFKSLNMIEDIELIFKLKIYDDTQLWRITTDSLDTFFIEDSNIDHHLHYHKKDHILLTLRDGQYGKLSFHGKTDDPEKLIGKLWHAHNDLSQGWIPFDRYLRGGFMLYEQIKSGYGILAQGPVTLLRIYQKALLDCGIKSNISDITPATNSVREMISFGKSYVIGESFHAELIQQQSNEYHTTRRKIFRK